MNLKPGCGCLILVLGVINALIAVSMVYAIATNPENWPMSLLLLAIFGANIGVCVIVGLATVRRGRGMTPASGDESPLTGSEGDEDAAVEDQDE